MHCLHIIHKSTSVQLETRQISYYIARNLRKFLGVTTICERFSFVILCIKRDTQFCITHAQSFLAKCYIFTNFTKIFTHELYGTVHLQRVCS